MKDNVYHFPQQVRNVASDVAENDRRPRAAEEKLRARDLKQLREIEAACNDKPKGGQLKWLTLEDRLRAARAVGELKNDLLNRGHAVAAAKELFPKLHRFIVEPDLYLSDEVHAKVLASELTAKVHPYLKAAAAIAKVTKQDEVDSKLRVLRHTALWQNWRRGGSKNDPVAVIDQAADEVSFLIERLVARIIRDEHLSELFACMRRVPGRWDLPTGCFDFDSGPCLFATAHEDSYEMWDEAPPLPSIPLVHLWHAGLSLRVCLAREVSLEPVDAQTSERPVSPGEGDERLAELHIYREIRLALGPTVNADVIGPLFESRIFAELAILDEERNTLNRGPLDFCSSCNLASLDPDHSATVQLDGRWHRFTPLDPVGNSDTEEDLVQTAAAISGLHVDSSLMWDFTPLADDKRCLDNFWISWTPADTEYFSHWFDRPLDLIQPVEFLANAGTSNLTWYPRTNLANLIEAVIYDGQLAAELHGEIARIRKAFETYEAEWRIRMQEHTAEQIATFDSDLNAPKPLPNMEDDSDDE